MDASAAVIRPGSSACSDTLSCGASGSRGAAWGAMPGPAGSPADGRPASSPKVRSLASPKGRSHRDSSRAAIFLSNVDTPVLRLDGQPPSLYHVRVAELVAQPSLKLLGELVDVLDRQA